MASMRQAPPRSRRRTGRPPWLLAVLAGVAGIVVIGLVFAIVSLARSGSADEETGSVTGDPSACATQTMTAAEALPPPDDIRLRVYNSTDKAGLAGRVAKELGARDFRIMRVANDPKRTAIDGVGEIRFGVKGETRAQALAFQIPGADLVNDGRRGATLDLAIGQSFTALADTEDVEARMAEETTVVSSCPSASSSPRVTDAPAG